MYEGGGEPSEGKEYLGMSVENIGKGGGKSKGVGDCFQGGGTGNNSFQGGGTGNNNFVCGDMGDDPCT